MCRSSASTLFARSAAIFGRGFLRRGCPSLRGIRPEVAGQGRGRSVGVLSLVVLVRSPSAEPLALPSRSRAVHRVNQEATVLCSALRAGSLPCPDTIASLSRQKMIVFL